MPNMRREKAPMPMQDAKERSRNFSEVALGYTMEVARDEAARCLNCKNSPCVSGCPVKIDIPAFLKEVANGNESGAYAILSRSSTLPAVCGRVCPQEKQCEARCVRGIKGEAVAIGRVERYVADWHMENGEPLEKPASNWIMKSKRSARFRRYASKSKKRMPKSKRRKPPTISPRRQS